MAFACRLCNSPDALLEDGLAYVRPERRYFLNPPLLVVPKRHVASFFDLTDQEQLSVLLLLRQAQRRLQEACAPAVYELGVRQEGRASRHHLNIRLVPRYSRNGALDLVGSLFAAWQRHRTRRELSQLSDRMLRDIGLRRDQIAEVEPFRRPRPPW